MWRKIFWLLVPNLKNWCPFEVKLCQLFLICEGFKTWILYRNVFVGMVFGSFPWIYTIGLWKFWYWSSLQLWLWLGGDILWILQWKVLWELNSWTRHQHWQKYDGQVSHRRFSCCFWLQCCMDWSSKPRWSSNTAKQLLQTNYNNFTNQLQQCH